MATGPTELVIANAAGKLSLSSDRITETRTGAAPAAFDRRPEAAPTDVAAYVGAYRSPELDTAYEVVMREGQLWLKRRKFPDAAMTPTIADSFLASGSGNEAHIEFRRDSSGRVSGFALTAGRVRHIEFQR